MHKARTRMGCRMGGGVLPYCHMAVGGLGVLEAAATKRGSWRQSVEFDFSLTFFLLFVISSQKVETAQI